MVARLAEDMNIYMDVCTGFKEPLRWQDVDLTFSSIASNMAEP